MGIYWYNEEVDNLESLGIDWSDFRGNRELLHGLSLRGDNNTLVLIANALLANTQLQFDYQGNRNYNYVYVKKQVDTLLHALREDGFIVDDFRIRSPNDNKVLQVGRLSREGVLSSPMEVYPRFKARSFTPNNKLAFVLMPLKEPFLSILKEYIKPVCAEFDLTAIHAGDIDEIEEIMENVWTSINQARVIIADLSTKNPNVFYELGIAHTLGRKVIMITQDDKDSFPFDISGIKGIRYTFPSEMKAFQEKFRSILRNLLNEKK